MSAPREAATNPGGGRAVRAIAAMALASCWIATGRARADDAPVAAAPSDHYPFAAEVRSAIDPARARLDFDGLTTSLPISSGSVAVGEQALAAYAAAVRGMFLPSAGAEPAIAVEVGLESARLEREGSAALALVDHTVIVRERSGAEVVRLHLRGTSVALGYEQRAIVSAFTRAAANAAGAFEKAFDESLQVQAWLAQHKHERRALRQEARLDGAPAVRGAFVTYLDGGAAFTGRGELGLSVRAGASNERFFLALTGERIGASFPAFPPFGEPESSAGITTMAAGLDAGVLHRLFGGAELRAGLGARLLGGTATLRYQTGWPPEARSMSITKSALGGSAFAGVVATARPWSALKLRARVGVELRTYFGGRLSFDAYGTSAIVPETLLSLFVGVELPVPGR